MPESPDNGAFEALLDYIKRSRAFDFSGYKRPGLMRRVQKRMEAVGVEDFASYTDYLEVHPDEFTHLFNTILINVTAFFRDHETWEYVAGEVIPRILQGKSSDDPVRVWCAGCATGEEAYTVAMLLLEALGPRDFDRRVKIFATDLDEEALTVARAAAYTDHQLEGVAPEMLSRYFERQNGRYVFHRDYRRAVIFGRHDLLQDAPISRIDLLTCRNTIMYFNSEAQARVLERFHFALADGGVLLMGKAEMLFSRVNLFAPLDLKRRSFVKASRPSLRDRVLVAAQNGTDEALVAAPPPTRPTAAVVDHMRLREAAFHVDPIASLIVDPSLCVTIVNEQARTLFQLSDRDIGRPLQDLEVSYRPLELRSRVEQALATRAAVEAKEVAWPTPLGEPRSFDIQVVPLFDAGGALLGIRVAFCDVSRFKRLQEELQQARQELETAYEELQSSNEERETANEELQSTNEELETTNEEIQSTNEELETMNEELQSTNEELQATNDQLRQRSDELSETNAFLRSILSSMRSGVAVVDKELRVRAWNHKAQELWGLRPEEVTSQFFLNLDIGLPVDQLKQAIRSAMNGSDAAEVVLKATNRRGREIDCRISCTAVRENGQGIWGVIIMMDEEKRDEAAGG